MNEEKELEMRLEGVRRPQREKIILAIFYCIANHPQTGWLKTAATTYFLPQHLCVKNLGVAQPGSSGLEAPARFDPVSAGTAVYRRLDRGWRSRFSDGSAHSWQVDVGYCLGH